MKKFLTTFIIFIFCVTTFSQKLTEPKLLGTWIAGEDSSEFIYHRVLETSLEYLNENPGGKLVVRICSPDNFSKAFVKAQLDPLVVTTYDFYNLITPERLFISNSSKCLYEHKFNTTEYWLVPDQILLEIERSVSVKSIKSKGFDVPEFGENDGKKLNEVFSKNIENFIKELKDNPKSEGFIIHNSKNGKMKRNIEKVLITAKKESVDIERIKTITKPTLDVNEKGKLYFVKDENKSFPNLAIIEVKN